MRAAIVIPARYASRRFPGKPLSPLVGATSIAKPLIQRSWEAACAVPDIDRVLVATDDDRIAAIARDFGAEVAMTPTDCANGTERCAAVVAALDPATDVIVNLQGDAPLTPAHIVTSLLAAMIADEAIAVATPVVLADAETHRRLLVDARAGRVGGTTVVGAASGDALYFSKAVIPHVGALPATAPTVLLHIGVYAYTRTALADYVARGPCRLEELEGLEQLRFLHAGILVRLVQTDIGPHDIWELNNPADVPLIEAALATRGIA